MAGIRQAHYPHQATIDAYGDGGFRFADMSHVGSIIILPTGIHGWEPDVDAEGLPNLSAFDAVLSRKDEIGVFLFGSGDDIRRLPKDIRTAFSEAGIVLECMATGAAARTFNIMLLEGRPVAAGLLAASGS